MGLLNRYAILKKTAGVGAFQALSKLFGFARELAFARFLGVGAIADAFYTAWRVPSLLRRFLAEGALNAASVPRFLQMYQEEGRDAVGRLVTALLIVIQSVLCTILLVIWLYPQLVLWGLVPGWGSDEVRFIQAIPAIRWCMLVILPFSASALLAGALQTVSHFYIPAISQLVFNILLVGHVAIGIYAQYTMWWLLIGVAGYSCIGIILHYWVYQSYGFTLAWPHMATWRHVRGIMRALLSCLVNYGAFEVNMLVDHILVSFLAVGSQSLLYYTSAFAQMPLSIFVSAFSTILLPQFTNVRGRTRRQQFYLLEAVKLAIWVLLPTTILMTIFSREIFATTILAHGSDPFFVTQAAWLLSCIAIGLIPFAVNRICMNVFYSIEMPGYAGVITVAGTMLNAILSGISMQWFGLFGVIASTVCAACGKVGAYLWMLNTYTDIAFPLRSAGRFVWRYTVQIAVTGWIMFGAYVGLRAAIAWITGYAWLMLYGWGLWIWVAPLCLGWFILLHATRRWFAIGVHFLPGLPRFNN